MRIPFTCSSPWFSHLLNGDINVNLTILWSELNEASVWEGLCTARVKKVSRAFIRGLVSGDRQALLGQTQERSSCSPGLWLGSRQDRQHQRLQSSWEHPSRERSRVHSGPAQTPNGSPGRGACLRRGRAGQPDCSGRPRPQLGRLRSPSPMLLPPGLAPGLP